MRWTKLGRVFSAENVNELMVEGARAPVPLHIGNGRYRIYFCSTDANICGRIFSLEFDIEKPSEIFNLVTEPIIDIGQIGYHDDNGISTSSLLTVDGNIYLYTIGFSRKNRIMFDAASGLAISRDGGTTFEKFIGPVVDRSVDDPCFSCSPMVTYKDNQWRMWYVSGERWEKQGDCFKHYYNIKHRTSRDGIYWDPHATVCLDFANEYEYAIARPSVICEADGRYRMWYSFRAQPGIETYRIGYAESDDGLTWVRKDSKVGIDVSAEGWDSEMICYPYVFEHNSVKYMLYNGNGYGRSGFGLAVLEDE